MPFEHDALQTCPVAIANESHIPPHASTPAVTATMLLIAPATNSDSPEVLKLPD